MFWKRSQEGYVVIDHRASPGLSDDVARASGYDPSFCHEGGLFETAALTCAHCKNAVVKNPLRVRERNACPKCDHHYICDFCAADMHRPDYVHTPYDKFVDQVLKQNSAGWAADDPRAFDKFGWVAPAGVFSGTRDEWERLPLTERRRLLTEFGKKSST